MVSESRLFKNIRCSLKSLIGDTMIQLSPDGACSVNVPDSPVTKGKSAEPSILIVTSATGLPEPDNTVPSTVKSESGAAFRFIADSINASRKTTFFIIFLDVYIIFIIGILIMHLRGLI